LWSSSPSVLGSVELVSIMAEFSCYCQSCGRNSIHWFMFDIKLPPPIAGS
jgi:hypothetical protein